MSTLPLLFTLVRLTENRDFEHALPLENPEVLPADHTRHVPVRGSLVAVPVVPALAMGLAWNPWLSLTPMSMALDCLVRGCVAARFERKRRVLLWRGQVEDRPWELSWSPAERSRPETSSNSPTETPL
ncbi:hypothetical protein [Streptomyces sp. NPDC002952]|uniref:hypothetical protein n=1 Tax=Streptomyces sp. NPDC002952 TaxID=3364673 RepID=UPI00367FD07E